MVSNVSKDPVTSLPTVAGTLAQSFRAGPEGAAFRTLLAVGGLRQAPPGSIHADNSSAVGDRLLTLANSGRVGVTDGAPITSSPRAAGTGPQGGHALLIVVDLVTDTALYKPCSLRPTPVRAATNAPGTDAADRWDHRRQASHTEREHVDRGEQRHGAEDIGPGLQLRAARAGAAAGPERATDYGRALPEPCRDRLHLGARREGGGDG